MDFSIYHGTDNEEIKSKCLKVLQPKLVSIRHEGVTIQIRTEYFLPIFGPVVASPGRCINWVLAFAMSAKFKRFLGGNMTRILAIGTAILMGMVVESNATVINFDDVADGTVINTHYAGVTFSNPLGGNVYAQAAGNGSISAPNAVSILNAGTLDFFFNATNGAVDASFATLQQTVSIDARAVGPVEFLGALQNRPFLEAYDSANNLLGKVLFAGALPTGCCFEFTPSETLTFTSGSANIAKVRFSSQISQGGAAVFGLFDNLSFTGATTNAVPEPATGLLLAGGLIGMAGLRWIKRQ